MTLTKGLYAGSFDPLTKGHLDIIERAADLVNTLYVGLFVNPQK
ncbi:adenylyltransferase/cytidyltransferase family protein, partial [Streptococcus danieliae]|nr:adenylyltransferase/cytidyltransferase family protein [Streptococcus danieliae]